MINNVELKGSIVRTGVRTLTKEYFCFLPDKRRVATAVTGGMFP